MALLSLLLLVSCGKEYDDGNLWNEVNSLDERVNDIEATLSKLNKDLTTIQALATSTSDGLSITNMVKTSNGWEITYNNGRTFTIPDVKDGRTPYIGDNGNWWIGTTDTGVKAKGKDGDSVYMRNGTWWIGDKDTGVSVLSGNGGELKDVPIIGIELYTDGYYYWTQTLNGVKTWLKDGRGNMIPVSGNGSLRPLIRIDYQGYWIYSVDGGIHWTFILNDKGEKVQYTYDGCPCTTYFKMVKVVGNNLIIILADGTVIVIPLSKGDDSPIPPDPIDPNPPVDPPYDPVPNPVIVIDDKYVARLDMTGIQDRVTGEWIKLYGTGYGTQQNVWLELDGKPKGILVINNSEESEDAKVRTDIVFTVDNSGSMSEEANQIAADIISWAQKLTASGLNVRFACVGYSVFGTINGAIDFCDATTLASYLNRSTGTSRTEGFSGSNASKLQSAASSYSVSDECGAMAIRYADANLSFDNLANRIYINFTDEPNQPNGNAAYSVEYFSSQSNWATSQGTVHTVYSDSYVNWSEQTLKKEWPWKISDYTGGTKFFTDGSFRGVSLDALPVSGAMINSYVIYFRVPYSYIDGYPHQIKLTVKTPDGHVRGEKIFNVIFTL